MMMKIMGSSRAVFLLIIWVVVSPSWIRNGLASRVIVTETPSPSPSSALLETPSPSQSPNHHEPPSRSSSQTPQLLIEPPSPQMPELPHYHHYEPPSASPSQAPYHNDVQPPSVSPSQAPKMSPYPDNEPPSPSPETESPLSPPSPPHFFWPPSPSPLSPPPQLHHGPHLKPPPSSTPLQCWSLVMEVNGCSNEIIMAYHGYNLNLKPSCCQAINRTSKDCLFEKLFSRTPDTFFLLWLKEHCARIAPA